MCKEHILTKTYASLHQFGHVKLLDAWMVLFVQALMIEMARIRLHGFSEREVSQARASMMSDVESAYIERDQDYSQASHTPF